MTEEETNLSDQLNATPAPAADEKKPKRCLMITPIGPVDSEIRRATDGLFEEVIEPVCSDQGYRAEVSHKMNEPGSVMDQVVGRLVDYELVIANLTLSNPNVMYELAVRHAARKPVISLLHEGSPLPFDLLIERVIPYRNDMKGVKELRRDLAKAIEFIHQHGDVVDNPIVRGTTRFTLKREEVPQTAFEAVERRLGAIEARLASGWASEPPPLQQAGPVDAFRMYFTLAGSALAITRFKSVASTSFESSRFAPMNEEEGRATVRGSVYETRRTPGAARRLLVDAANQLGLQIDFGTG